MNALYTIIIQPLFLLFEFIFKKMYGITVDNGVSIIAMSLAINVLVLPLYQKADSIQAAENEKTRKMAGMVKHIKSVFKGDERYMMLQTYYNQRHYKQIDSLKSLLPLLLQIPFFIAAYQFLSGLKQLQGASFLMLADLGRPDALIRIGEASVNALPILMTLVNLVSSSVYMKGMPSGKKIQLYVTAGVFLVLLYDSPSGLVMYWTMNNLFSLVKNVFSKLKNPRKVLSRLSFAAGLCLIPCALLIPYPGVIRWRILAVLAGFVLLLPAVAGIIRTTRKPGTKRGFKLPLPDLREHQNSLRLLYVLGAVYLMILIGLLIPSAVVASSPGDFISAGYYRNPLRYVLSTAGVFAGVFGVWMTVFFAMTDAKGKAVFAMVQWLAAGMCTVQYMAFAKNMGNISPQLVFDNAPAFSNREILVNLAVLVAVALILFFVFIKAAKTVPVLYLALLTGVAVLTGSNIVKINSKAEEIKSIMVKTGEDDYSIPLSRNGKNVVVLMMDRSISDYFPYLLQEKPELKERYAGFTYYPNTVSLGTSTNSGAPCLFAGYEYSPFEINKRPEETLAAKHDEALKVMPVLFAENGFRVTVSDPPYAGYEWIPNVSIYDPYPGITAFNMRGGFDDMQKESDENKIEHNFAGYSIMKAVPLLFQSTVYQDGNYNSTDNETPDYTVKFLESYYVLENLPAITEILDSEENTFFIMDNETVHEPCELQLPEYVPVAHVNWKENKEYEDSHPERYIYNGVLLQTDTDWKRIHYYSHMSAYLKLAEWLDFMRKEGVYDNTRIIIVSDHGYGLRQFDNLIYEDGFDLQWFTPLLLVKDFGDTGYSVSEEFMTNADTPVLATQGLIDAPRNPFTGNPITCDEKKDGVTVFHTTRWGIDDNNGNTFVDDPDNAWFTVRDDRRILGNWQRISNPFPPE